MWMKDSSEYTFLELFSVFVKVDTDPVDTFEGSFGMNTFKGTIYIVYL